MPFSKLGLAPTFLVALQRTGLTIPTPIQTATIPIILSGTDVVAKAQTGSGKTLAYGLALLQNLTAGPANSNRDPRALVLVPTRELAIQVSESLRRITSQLPQALKVSVIFGGVSINPQMMAMRGGTDVLIATPGRLLDLMSRNALTLSNVNMLVLDEADRLLDMGFNEELHSLRALLPATRQSLFFSATFPTSVTALTQTWSVNPTFIEIDDAAHKQPDIAQRAIAVDTGRRTQLLRHLIQDHHWKRTLVFVATKHAAEIVADKLRKARIYAEPFHGELSQGKRNQVLSDFKASRLKVVVATDMASRGLDIAELPVVVNFDLPRSSDDYTHRIGRTGRAGEAGLAVSFVTAATQAHFHLIEKRNSIHLNLETVVGFEPTEVAPAPNSGGIKGNRHNKKDKLRAQAAAQALPADTPLQ
jgi:ATP-dependent RNA helicase RhlE